MHDHTSLSEFHTPVFLISAPSGSGKTTVIKKVLEDNKQAVMPISHTTREQRSNEEGGRDYHFVTREKFESMVEDGAFAEWADYSGNYYGTSYASLEAADTDHAVIVHELDVQGVSQLIKKLSCVTAIMLVPEQPYLENIEKRLRSEEFNSEAEIQTRLAKADWELDHRELFNYIVENRTDHIDEAASEIQTIITKVIADQK